MFDILSDGKYIDLWTVNHFLSGFIIAGWLVHLGVPKWHIVGIATVLFLGWEIFEYIYHIEKIPNQAADLLANYFGLLVLFLAGPLLQPHTKVILIAATILFLILEIYCLISFLGRPRAPLSQTSSRTHRNLVG